MPPLRGLSMTQRSADLASTNRQGTDLLRMSDHGRVHQNKDGGMLFPYPPTKEKEPNLAVHRHRSGPPDVRKTTRLTIARICLHQSSAASSSATMRHIPV